MTTLLALLVFAAIAALLGILLAKLSSSSAALSFHWPAGWRRGKTFECNRAPASSESQPGQNDSSDTQMSPASASADGSVESATDQPLEQLIEAVNARLPQTQCAQCGHPGCRPYANAIVLDDAPINQCPPGGDALIGELANFLGKQAIPLDAERGENKAPQVAMIDEPACIGCTLCILACPVDAIVGASRLMHTVISDQCTGCELCLPPCPVDCIELVPAPVPLTQWRWPKPA